MKHSDDGKQAELFAQQGQDSDCCILACARAEEHYRKRQLQLTPAEKEAVRQDLEQLGRKLGCRQSKKESAREAPQPGSDYVATDEDLPSCFFE
jgi:hypothetical protein